MCFSFYAGVYVCTYIYTYRQITWIGKLLMGFLGSPFLPFRASFSTTFLENCNGSICLGTTTFPNSVEWGKLRHAPCRIRLLHKANFCVSRI